MTDKTTTKQTRKRVSDRNLYRGLLDFLKANDIEDNAVVGRVIEALKDAIVDEVTND